MPVPRPIACAALAAATAVAVALPAQAGLAATASYPTDGPVSGRLITVSRPQASQDAAAQQQAGPSASSAAPTSSASSSGSSATPSSPSSASATSSSSSAPASSASTSAAQADRSGVPASSGSDAASDEVEVVDGTDAADDEVEVIDGTDAPEDDSDALADDGTATSTRADRTSGRWAQVARPTRVRSSATSSARAKVAWRSGTGGLLAQRFVVELRSGRSVLRVTTFSSARSATLWGLVAGKRYTVKVTAVAADGTRRTTTGAPLRAPAARTAKTSRVAAAAKAAARHAKAVSLR